MDVAMGISKSLAERMVAAVVDGKIYDLHRPLEQSCNLELKDFESKEGKHAFWHSSAHILGAAIERYYGAHLCMGPPLEDGGFYYDCEMQGRVVVADDIPRLLALAEEMSNGKHPFERLTLTKEEALEMFKDNPFKLEIIRSKIPDGQTCTAYRCGFFIDLCKGPHLVNTGKVKALSITKNAASYWLGKAENAPLQRIYGISFPDKKQLKEYEHMQEEAARRDHRKLGQDQQLFFFHELSPGSCFWLPHGARIYNTLINMMRAEYRRRGFDEVISPNVYNVDLWKTSGHYQNYKDNMFMFKCENVEFGMKPMNCPGHCIMFRHTARSYRELPLRMADFGVLHRNEASGALTGLTRVRRFQQDDAHIFCRESQIEAEIAGALDFLKNVYGRFNFEFNVNLSTRPEKFMGDIETWNRAEAALAASLRKYYGDKWHENKGDGAFYGPKIDIQLTDALRRRHQCATIQLDFQLPRNFQLHFRNEEDKEEVPVIIHRAILGSVERMTAILIEHYGGKWPFWLSPRQALVVPVALPYVDYARHVQKTLWDAGYFVDVDDSRNQLNKKIREGQLAQYNFILVVGDDEAKSGTVTVRTRDNQVADKPTPLQELLAQFAALKADFK
jgi:threonyl-tRNA synthetase